MLGNVQKLGFVTDVTSPYSSGLISKDGTIGLATVQLDSDAQNLPESEAKALIHTAQAARSSTLNVQLGGAAIQNAENQGGGSGDFLVGALLALVVLFFAFRRSVLSALLPLLSALVAIGIGTSFIAILSHAFSVPQFATQLAELIALGVGVDYALFIVNRHRRELLAGRSPEEAVVRALNTSGRAVLVAGLTVCIALLGMFALALTFLYGVSLGAALVVFLTMLSSITLLPAMLGFYGYKALSRRDRRRLLGEAQAAAGVGDRGASPFWTRWADMVGRRSGVLSALSLALIAVIALPFFGLRLGLADSGEDPSASTTRHAYDLLAQGFGPGYNSPLQLVGKLNGPADLPRFDTFVSELSHTPGVADVLPTRTSPNGKAVVAIVYPRYSPQAPQTTTLVNHIRSEVPAATAGSSLAIHVGGVTAQGIDFSKVLSDKLPLFVAVIVVLAFVLLTAGVPQPARPPAGLHHEHPLHRGRPRRHRRRLPVRVAQAAAGLRPGRTDRGVPARHDVRRPVRPVHGLRGVPGQPHARGMGHQQGQPPGGHPGPGRDRPGHHRRRAHHDPGIPVLQLRQQRSGHQGVRHRLRRCHHHRRLCRAHRAGPLPHARARSSQLVAAPMARPPAAHLAHRRRRPGTSRTHSTASAGPRALTQAILPLAPS